MLHHPQRGKGEVYSWLMMESVEHLPEAKKVTVIICYMGVFLVLTE